MRALLIVSLQSAHEISKSEASRQFPQDPNGQVYLQGENAVGAFHTNLCEAAINISNSTVNAGLPTAASMRNEPTNSNLEKEKKLVRSHDCFALGLLNP